MTKRYLFIAVLLAANLILALIYTLVYFTHRANILIVVFQSLYWSLDRVAGIVRAIVYLLVASVTTTLAFGFHRHFEKKLNTRWLVYILLFSTGGVLLGLLVHYADVCCDSPVIFYFGFPLSWMRGVTNSWNLLPTSPTIYLIQNFGAFKWNLVLWNLFASLLFWFNAGFILFAIRNLRLSLLPATNVS